MSWLDAKPEAPAPDAPPTERPRERMKKKLKSPAPKEAREQSTIAFPYMDLDAGISVARSIIGAGGVALTRDQLAGAMKLSAGSGNFVLKVATARMFGLIANVGGKYELTNLGFSIVDSDDKRQRAARADAFLSVPLYKRTYEEFKGKQLPPRPHGLEQAFAKFGVATKQKGPARYAFEKAAAQAGFFASGNDRLIEPILGGVQRTDQSRSEDIDDAESASRGWAAGKSVIPKGLHPFIQGLLEKLPEPETTWTIEGRAKWLQAAAHIFDLMYKGDGAIEIKPKVPPSPEGE